MNETPIGWMPVFGTVVMMWMKQCHAICHQLPGSSVVVASLLLRQQAFACFWLL